MSIIRFPSEEIKQYYESSRLNQSALKVVAREGMQSFLEKREQLTSDEEWYSEKLYQKIGSAVDYYLSNGEDIFIRNHHFSSIVNTPTGAALSITRKVFDTVLARVKEANRIEDISSYKEEIFDACNQVVVDGKVGYYMNRAKSSWEADERHKTLITPEVREYFGDLVEGCGKIILSEEEARVSQAIARSFLDHSHSSSLFINNDDVDIIYQLPLYFTLEDEECKALLDMLRIVHSVKTIFPIDFKTTGSHLLNFNQAIKSYGYDLQGSFYTKAITLCLQYISELIGKDISDYKIANFAFLAESVKKQEAPLIFPLTDALILQGERGDGRYSRQNGWYQGLVRYKLWKEKEFSIEKMFESSKGIVWVDELFEYSKMI